MNKILLSIGFDKKEIEGFLIKDKDIEEKLVLLSSLYIENFKEYICEYKYLLNYNIYDLAYLISNIFDKKRDFSVVRDILTNEEIISKKGDNSDIF